jgi:AraC-like DNA-binding protein
MEQSLTLRDALATFVRKVGSYSSHVRFWLAPCSDGMWLCRRTAIDCRTGCTQVEHYVVGLMVRMARLAGGPTWRPETVCLTTGRAPALENTEPLGNAAFRQGGDITAIAIPTILLSSPVRRNVEPGSDGTNVSGLLSDLKASVAAALENGPPRVELAAEIARASVRTLHRRLAAEGLTYGRLVDQARFDAARDLLRQPCCSLVEVSLRLGYSDQAHFTRAFRRWTGVPPGLWRRQRDIG